MTSELEKARAILAQLEQAEAKKVWSSNENISNYLLSVVEPVMYKGEPQTNSQGQVVSRIPISALAELVAFIGVKGFNVQAGQKYVNLINQ